MARKIGQIVRHGHRTRLFRDTGLHKPLQLVQAYSDAFSVGLAHFILVLEKLPDSDELLAGPRMLAVRQAVELLLAQFSPQTRLGDQSPVPLSANLASLIVVCLLRSREILVEKPPRSAIGFSTPSKGIGLSQGGTDEPDVS